MNPKDFFEFQHHRLNITNQLSEISDTLRQFNRNTFIVNANGAVQEWSLHRPTNETVYYAHDQTFYIVNKKENQQGSVYVGYSVQYLTLVKYKGIYEMDNLTIETNLESLKKNKVYRVLSQQSNDNIREGMKVMIFNETHIEEQDEYSLSYMLIYRMQTLNQQEQFRLEKKQQYSFKAIQPFSSHYSMVTDNFPEIYFEYQCLNVSDQQLLMKWIEFKVDRIMEIKSIERQDMPLLLQKDEGYQAIYRIMVNVEDLNALKNVLTQKSIKFINLEDTYEYDIKLGNIFLQWGTCGIHNGTPKNCMLRIYPIVARLVNPKEIHKEAITRIELSIELGIFTLPVEVSIKLEEADMRLLKIVGLSEMKLTFDEVVRKRSLFIDLLGFIGGVHQIRGIKFIDVKTQKAVPFRNALQISVISAAQKQEELNLI